MTRCLQLIRTVVFAGVAALLLGAIDVLGAQDGPPRRDLSKDKTLYVVGYAHLDTQWRWDYVTTIDQFIHDTLTHNFDRFEAFPGYTFNFTGSVRYEMMEEYYPEAFERLKGYIEEGRWFVSGSAVDEGDLNVPSAEAVLRQVLYGNQYFRRAFGKESVDFMLPDCFGFPASMPSIWAHCGLKGFSTQKLTWDSAIGIPFNIGVWEGPDGRSVLAALNPGDYVGHVNERLDTHPDWVKRVNDNGNHHGVFADYHYYGVGDRGGAPREADVQMVMDSIGNADSQVAVLAASSDQMFKDITPEQKARLPRHKGDMLLTEHSAGTLTSQAYMKRWNRKAELLADAAERAAVGAAWMDGAAYPHARLNRSWVRVLVSQMHDMLPGTSIPKAYEYSWNDEVLALNGFGGVLEHSVSVLSQALDTRTEGQALVVYNPIACEREDVVEAAVRFPGGAPEHVRVTGPDGKACPVQIIGRSAQGLTILFAAQVPSVGLAVYTVHAAQSASAGASPLRVHGTTLENERYRVRLNSEGDVASVIDKKHGHRELLAAPARLEFLYERPETYPAWNMAWADRQKSPMGYVDGPATIRIKENGPVRVSLEVVREARDSIFTQEIRLAAGSAGDRVEFKTHIDWQSQGCSIKHAFPLTISNLMATYNWGLGTIARGNNEPKRYENPSHEWFDLTDAAGDYGVSVLEDSKFGSDKPADNILRLTLLYTPEVRHLFLDQATQDWGRHDMMYALYGHAGDWRQGRTEWQGRRLNSPLSVYQASAHAGTLGTAMSLAALSSDQVDVRAIKQAEDGDHLIVRLQELWGKPCAGVRLTFGEGIASAWETDGQERKIGPATLSGAELVVDMAAYSPRTFAIVPKRSRAPLTPPTSQVVALPYDTDVVSGDDKRDDGMFSEGRSYPAEMLPAQLRCDAVPFTLGPTADGALNAVVCRGQTVALPDGEIDHLYLLAAADRDTQCTFLLGDQAMPLAVQCWTGFIGQFDNRVWDRAFGEIDYRCSGRVRALKNGYIKRDAVAWFATHCHTPKRNEAYQFTYLFKYALTVPKGAVSITLPDNPMIKLMAMTAVSGSHAGAVAAYPLYDDFTGRSEPELRVTNEPKYLKGVTAKGVVALDRKASFEALSMGAPVTTDYADQASNHGVEVHYVDEDGCVVPHTMSGSVETVLPRLIDGEIARHSDDTARCVWYDTGEGRLLMDLRKSVTVDRVQSYSWHKSNRGPQRFSLWGARQEQRPSPIFSATQTCEWELLGRVDSWSLGEGGIHGSRIAGKDGALGTYRWLMWVVDAGPETTFFTELDVVEKDQSVSSTSGEGVPLSPVKISFDCTGAPDLTDWAARASVMMEEWYAKLGALLLLPGQGAPIRAQLTIKDMQGVGGTSGTHISVSAAWVRKHPGDFGMVIHELAHVVQSYPKYDPPWLVEALADYVRFYHFEPEANRPRVKRAEATARDSYQTGAAFMHWIAEQHGIDVLTRISASLRRGDFSESRFKEYTGRTLDELFADYQGN